MDAMLVVKATLLLSATLLAARLLRRAPAATRHGLWTVGFAAVLALPLLAFALPALRISVPGSFARPIPLEPDEQLSWRSSHARPDRSDSPLILSARVSADCVCSRDARARTPSGDECSAINVRRAARRGDHRSVGDATSGCLSRFSLLVGSA